MKHQDTLLNTVAGSFYRMMHEFPQHKVELPKIKKFKADHVEVFQETNTTFMIYVLDQKSCVLEFKEIDISIPDKELVREVKSLTSKYDCKVEWCTDLDVRMCVDYYTRGVK